VRPEDGRPAGVRSDTGSSVAATVLTGASAASNGPRPAPNGRGDATGPAPVSTGSTPVRANTRRTMPRGSLMNRALPCRRTSSRAPSSAAMPAQSKNRRPPRFTSSGPTPCPSAPHRTSYRWPDTERSTSDHYGQSWGEVWAKQACRMANDTPVEALASAAGRKPTALARDSPPPRPERAPCPSLRGVRPGSKIEQDARQLHGCRAASPVPNETDAKRRQCPAFPVSVATRRRQAAVVPRRCSPRRGHHTAGCRSTPRVVS
jgi:hypothetical protein